MPSFWEHTRLDVLHVPGVATRVSTRSIAITCAPTSLAAPPPDIPAHARWIPPRALESRRARENPPRAEIIRAGGSVAPSLFLLVCQTANRAQGSCGSLGTHFSRQNPVSIGKNFVSSA